jgi:hypothetical protein
VYGIRLIRVRLLTGHLYEIRSVRLAHSNQTVEEITENIEQGLNAIAKHLKKWANVKSANLKTTNKISLPFYHSLPTPAVFITDATLEEDDDQ